MGAEAGDLTITCVYLGAAFNGRQLTQCAGETGESPGWGRVVVGVPRGSSLLYRGRGGKSNSASVTTTLTVSIERSGRSSTTTAPDGTLIDTTTFARLLPPRSDCPPIQKPHQ